MAVLKFFVTLFMIMIIPISNLFAPCHKGAEGTFTDPEPIIKQARVAEKFTEGANDIILNDGDDLSEAVEKAKALGGAECTIWLHGGVYNLNERITLDGVKNLSIKAYPNEKAEITAVKEITGFSETEVNGVKAWVAPVGEGESFGTLFNGDKKLSLTRYPESGYFLVEKADRSVSMFTEENSPWIYTRGDRAFYSKSDIGLDSFYNLTDVQYKLMHYWYCENSTLTSYENGRIGVKQPCTMIVEENDRFFFENVFEALNTAGEWYHDTVKNVVYYIPQEGEDISSTVLTAPVENMLFDIKNCENINFSGLTIKNTDWCYLTPDPSIGWLAQENLIFPQGNLECNGVFDITNSSSVNFKNCDFLNIGNGAIRLNKLVKGSEITGCTFKEIGGNAIFIDGWNTPDASMITENITVCDNLIEGYGRTFPSGIGILLTHAQNCKITHNEIHDGYYTAISCGWVWGYSAHTTDYIEISENLIYDIGQGWLSDMGGIYMLGIQPHTVLTHNKIYNVAADPNEGGYGGWGIYLDEGSSHITVYQNLAYDCGSTCFHQHYGEENNVTNNIFALGKEAQIQSSRSEEHNEFNLTKNIILSDGTQTYCQTNKDRFKDDSNLYWDLTNGKNILSVTGASGDTRFKNRLYAPIMEKYGYYNNAVFADPLFKDPRNFDFTLADNSPAITEIGFETWNYNTAGTLTQF